MSLIETSKKILFQGDSITDAGRIRIGNNLGVGYVFIITAWIRRYYPHLKIEIINRGISGNTVIDLQSRWKEDCLDLQPDILTVLIGVNDCVNKISDQQYEQVYDELLTQVKQYTTAKIILMEPFLLEVKPEHSQLSMLVKNKCAIVKKLADKFGAIFIPLNTIFNELLNLAPAEYWAHDGIHPSPQGHFIIAETWLKTVGIIK